MTQPLHRAGANGPLNAILNAALPRWAALTGTKLKKGKRTLRLSFGGGSMFDDFALEQHVKTLNSSRKFDASGVTTLLLLRGLFSQYIEQESFSGKQLLDDDVGKRLQQLREFRGLLWQPETNATVNDFQAALRAATTHYGYDGQRLEELFDDELAIGELRHAAFHSLNTLRVHQFTHGPTRAQPLQYNPTVYQFWNINSLLVALQHQWVAGITMTLIRDAADPYQSYFALGLRNQDTLSVLTDLEPGPHPDHYNMTRRPDRRLAERATEHWFPYQFLERKKTTDDDDRLLTPSVDDAALVRMNTEAVPLGEIRTLEPAQFVWTALLFELLSRRFGVEQFKTSEISYTGEMLVEPTALVEASSALVKAGHYTPLVLEPVTLETATPQTAKTDERVGHLAWMEETYASRVPSALLNVVGDQAALRTKKQALRRLKAPAPVGEFHQYGAIPDDRDLDVRALQPTQFGTKATIVKDRAWAARVNLMQGVQRLAEADFAKRRDRIWAWFKQRVQRNADTLVAAAVRGELLAPDAIWSSKDSSLGRDRQPFPLHDELIWRETNLVRVAIGRTFIHAFPGHSEGAVLGRMDRRYNKAKCFLRPHVGATVFAHLSVNNPRALALITGVSENKLPWPLEHWYKNEPYTGNFILSRVDPQDWILENPWSRMSFNVTIALCKRAWKAKRKALGLVPDTKLIEQER